MGRKGWPLAFAVALRSFLVGLFEALVLEPPANAFTHIGAVAPRLGAALASLGSLARTLLEHLRGTHGAFAVSLVSFLSFFSDGAEKFSCFPLLILR